MPAAARPVHIVRPAPSSAAVSVPGAGPAADVELLDVRRAGPGRVRPSTVLLGRPEDPGLWDRAAALGGYPVAVLPDASGWLADRLAGAPGGPTGSGPDGRVLGLLGAVGGAETSTLACWLADRAAAEDRPAALVDGDRDGCGIDVLLGLEDRDALRWPDLLRIAGAVHADQLWPAMARTGPLRWLSWDRSGQDGAAASYASVLDALRRAAAVIVVDLGRAGASTAETAGLCDEVLVVAPRTVRGVLAARRAAGLLAGVPARLVLAGLNVADLDDALAAATTGLLVAGPVRFEGSVPEAAETGRLLGLGARAVPRGRGPSRGTRPYSTTSGTACSPPPAPSRTRTSPRPCAPAAGCSVLPAPCTPSNGSGPSSPAWGRWSLCCPAVALAGPLAPLGPAAAVAWAGPPEATGAP